MQQQPKNPSQKTLNSASSGQIEEENKSDYTTYNLSIQSQYQKNFKQLTEIEDILNKQKTSRSKKWELVNSVMNNLKEEEASNAYLNNYILDLEQNHSVHTFKYKTISRGSKSQDNSSADSINNLSDQTICKASSAQSKNTSQSNLGNNEQSLEASNYITIHKKSSKGSNESNKMEQKMDSNNQSSNQIIQVESNKEVLSNKKLEDNSVTQNLHSEDIQIESEPSVLSISKMNSSSQSIQKDSNQIQQISSKQTSLSSSCKESNTSSSKSQSSSNQSHTSSSSSSSSNSQSIHSNQQNIISKDSCTSSKESHRQSNVQISSSQQSYTSSNQYLSSTKQTVKKSQNLYQEALTQNKYDEQRSSEIYQQEKLNQFGEANIDQNIYILKEDTYMKVGQVIEINKGKAALAVYKSAQQFVEYFQKNKLRIYSQQAWKKEVSVLEKQIQTLKQIEENEVSKKMIELLTDELKKKFIEDNQKDEEIILKNQSLIQQLKNQVRCTKKNYIERIFIAIYRQKYKLTKYLTSGGQADILIGTFLNGQNKEKEYVFRIVSSDQETYDYIKEEYELVKKFQKTTNIIKYYDSIYLEDIHTGVFVVEKCTGSLTGVLQSKRNNKINFTEQEIIKIAFDLVQGLIEMRSYNILHQDIKPDNILINKKGNYIYSDFGCSSKFLDGLAENKGFTMKYCAPEQLIEDYFSNYKADIYQLGRTIQQILDLYEKFGGAPTKFIKDLNVIVFDNMLQESQEKRKECIDILILLCDSIVESQQKSFAGNFILWIEKQINRPQLTEETETNFSLKSLILFHFIWFQLKLFQGGYQMLIQKKSEQQFLNEIFEQISQDISLNKSTTEKIQLSQNQILHLKNLCGLATIYNLQSNDESVYKIACFLLKISEGIDHQNQTLFCDAIYYLQQQSFEEVDLSKYMEYIEDIAESQNDSDFYQILAYYYFNSDKNKSFYFSLKIYAQQFKKYVEFTQSENLQVEDFFTLGYYYVKSLSLLTDLFTEMNMVEIVLQFIQFIRTLSLHLNLEKQFKNYLIQLGLNFFKIGQYKKALLVFQEGIDQSLNQNSESQVQSFYFYFSKFKIGCCYYELKEFESAQKEFLELLQLIQNSLKKKLYLLELKTLSYIVAYFDEKSQFKQSIIYYSKLIKKLEDINNKEDKTFQELYPYTLFKLAMGYCQPEAYDQNKSITYFTKFLVNHKEKDICELNQDQRKAIIVSQNGLAYFYFTLKEYKNSEFYYTSLLKSFVQVSDYEDQIFEIGLNNLMTIMIQQDQSEDEFYHKFIDLVIEVVKDKKITNDQQKNDIIKDIQKAFEYCQVLDQEEMLLKNNQLISLLEHFNIQEVIYITILNHQACVLFENGQYDQAIIFYEKSLPIMTNLYLYPNEFVVIVQSGLAMAYHQLRQFKTAINYYDSALKTMKDLDYQEKEEKHSDMINCIDRILMCFQGFGNTPLALEFYQNFQNIIPFLYEESHHTIKKFNTQYETCQKQLSQSN